MNIKTKFKETEIGLIPEEWEVNKLGNRAKILMGQSPQSIFLNNQREGLEFLQGTKTFGERFPYFDTWTKKNTKLAKKGSVLLSVRAPVGEINLVDRNICIGRGLASISSDDNCFLYYLLFAYKDYIIDKEKGTVYGAINKNDIFNLNLPFPPLSEQKQISEILSSLDDKIEINRKMNNMLEEIGKTIFKEWFIDFEFPDEKKRKYKSSGGKMIDSELGKIPEGWGVGKIGDFARVKSGFAFKRDNFNSENGMVVIKIKNIIDPNIDLDSVDYVSEKSINKKAKEFILETKDILIAMSGNTTGKIGIMPKIRNNYILNQRVGKYFFGDKNNSGYLYFYLKSGDVQEEIIQSAYGSAQPNISPDILENIRVLIPKDYMLKKFNEISNSLLDDIVNNNFENNILSQIRDLLLPRLMNGRIRVK